MSNINQLNNLLKIHLSLNNLPIDTEIWRIDNSDVNGRGIFANRDIQPGEIIFIDHPILIGPRAGTNFKFHCVVCGRINDLQCCKKGCGLPICSSTCELSEAHKKECDLINKLSNKKLGEIHPELFRSLTPLKGFLLDNNSKELIKCLKWHEGGIHGFEIDLIKKILTLNEKEKEFLKIVCCVMDSNAFASVIKIDNSQISVRALYPLSALLNHCCQPNVTHLYNSRQQMIVKSAVFIPQNAEVFTTYTSLLWGTSLRRHCHFRTKHFWCFCNRCKDPKEFGSCLSGLKCINNNCSGIIYPVNPLNNFSEWKCDDCEVIVSSQKVGLVQSVLGSLLKSINVTDLNELISLTKYKLEKIIPVKNHITFELKLKIIWTLGHVDNYFWNDLSIDHLNYKEKLCNDVLEVLTELRLGQCKMRGLILYELYKCRIEKCNKLNQNPNKDNEELIKEASDILENDVTAPPEIKSFIEAHKKSFKKP